MNVTLISSSSTDGKSRFNSTAAECGWNLINPIVPVLLDSVIKMSNIYKTGDRAYLTAYLILVLTWRSRVGQLLWQPSVEAMSILQTRFPGLVKPICFFTTEMIGFENQGQVKCSDPVLGKGQ